MTKTNYYHQDQSSNLTAKGDQRQFVKHCYTDHSNEHGDMNYAERFCLVTYDSDGDALINSEQKHLTQMVQSPTFPLKLHMILEKIEESDSRMKNAISWLPHGRAFHIRNVDIFKHEVLPKYFKSCKLSSFYRQINLYGFIRLTTGCETGAYYHEYFLRARAFLTKNIIRTKVKGTKIRPTSAPEDEPNFYGMVPVSALPKATGISDIAAGIGSLPPGGNTVAMLAASQDTGTMSLYGGPMQHNNPQNSRQDVLLAYIASLNAQQESMSRLQSSVSMFNGGGYLIDNHQLPSNEMSTSHNNEILGLPRNTLMQNEFSRTTALDERLQAAMHNVLSRDGHNDMPRMLNNNERQEIVQRNIMNPAFSTSNLFEAVLSGRSGNDRTNFNVESRG